MQIAKSVEQMRALRAELPGLVGFVPTMGFLHEGHLSLVRQAKAACDNVVVSIYINPSQFAPGEDLATYPRNMERDLELLSNEGCDVVFTPDSDMMYPDGFDTWIKVKDVDRKLEAESRPHFFTGVATVVTKLFNIVQADKAFFGRKDAQQLLLVTKMVKDLNIPTEIIPGETVREADGLAMSSRNSYLKPDQRKAATVLCRALSHAKDMFESGEKNGDILKAAMLKMLENEPLAQVDYVSIANMQTLEEVVEVENPSLASMAVFIGKVRLIDNLIIG